jgi:hypothetical protein
MAPEPVDVEPGACVALGGELCREAPEQRRLGRELERERLVFGKRFRHQFRQSGRVEHAPADAPREGLAHGGDDRQPGPERIARRAQGIAGERVEKQAGEAMARQMVCVLVRVLVFVSGESRCEDQPFAIDAPPLGLGAKVGRGGGMPGGKP